MPKKLDELVTVYPDPGGLFIDGVPAIEQQVTEADAEWMCAHGAFTRTKPEAPAEPPAS